MAWRGEAGFAIAGQGTEIFLTEVEGFNMIIPVGRKKKGYSGPQGLIKKPGSENWYICWRKIQKSTGTPDLDRARLILLEVQRMVLSEEAKAREILGHSVPFSKLIARYLKEISPGKRSARADGTNSRHPLQFFGEKRIDTLTIQDIYKYMDWRKTAVSGPTINREISLISDAFRKGIRWGMVEKNPCSGIERFHETNRERYITDEELQTIRKVVLLREESAHVADILDALYYTGQRCGRIFDLKWSQVNLQERSITFAQTSKNKKVPDVIYITDPLFALLYRIRARRTLSKVVGAYVFAKSNGMPYRSVRTAWKRACETAGVKNCRIHDIRHKSITDMLNAGIPVAKVKIAVGHSNTSTTDGYSHLSVAATREALESLVK